MSRTELNVLVIPNASRGEVVGWYADALKIKTVVAPESGKAICALLVIMPLGAKHFGLPKRAVSVLHGQTNQMKCLQIEGLTEAELGERLGC